MPSNKIYYSKGFVEKRPVKVLQICEELTPLMNDVHNVNFSVRFWTTILSDYVHTCVNREPYLSAEISKRKPLLLPISSWEIPDKKTIILNDVKYFLKSIFESNSIKSVNNFLSSKNNICIGARSKEFQKYNVGVHCAEHIPFLYRKLKNPRKKIRKVAPGIENIFLRNVLLEMPKYYVEYFRFLLKKITLFDASLKKFHTEHNSPFTELIVAYYIEHGAERISYQKGGFNGEYKQNINPLKYFIIDKYRTYGWKIHEKDEPSYAFRLEEFAQKYNRIPGKVKYDAAIIYNFISEIKDIKGRYFKNSKYIFNHLRNDRYNKIVLRPRKTISRFLSSRSSLLYLEPPRHVFIDNGKKDMAIQVKESRLVIHLSHPSTNFLECMYVDHPVVAILDNNQPTEIIKPYYEFFLEQGIMHYNVESMVEHLNNIELESWWSSVIALPMYKEFKYKFARAVPGGLKHNANL